jgi:manganese transport protein
MSSFFELTLGIISATGGFVDVGELIFTAQAGAQFVYSLIWVVVLGTIGIIVYGEMAGRVAAVTKEAVFTTARNKLGNEVGLIGLLTSFLITVIVCAAEVGGIGLILELFLAWPYWACVVIAVLFLLTITWIMPFSWIEKTFGTLGLFMLIFLAAVFVADVDWGAAAYGLIPTIPIGVPLPKLLLYLYFVFGIFISVMMPYELFFYSSGAIEEKWGIKDLMTNRLVTAIGFSLGSLLAIAIVINAAVLLGPQGISPQLLGSTALEAAIPFGKWGLILGLFGMLFAITGAAIETCLSSAYIVCQFFGLPWGKEKKAKDAPIFYLIWTGVLSFAALLALFGPEPMQMAEYGVIFSGLALPLTYLTTFLAANDRKLMGKHANGRLSNAFGILFLILVIIAAVAAVPLMILTSLGQIS